MRTQPWWGLLVGLGIVPGLAAAQQSAPGAGLLSETSKAGAAGTQPQPQPDAAANPAVRYRIQEQYATADPPPAGRIGAYRIGCRETIAAVIESGQGAPTRTEKSTHVIYLERPTEINPLSHRLVAAAVRRYEQVRLSPQPTVKPSEPPLFEGLTFWYQTRLNDPPLVLVLTPDRRLRSPEYYLVGRQLFFPSLALTLPELPARKGDSYQLSLAGAEALMGTNVLQGNLTSKLEEIQDDPAGSGRKQAVFDISGDVLLRAGQAQVHAQLWYTFTPGSAPRAASLDAALGVVEAPGWISKLNMAQEIVSVAGADPNDRRRQWLRRELVAERQIPQGRIDLEAPRSTPSPTRQNSWLTFQDPQGQYQFEHPQEFQPVRPPNTPPEADSVDLIHPRPEGVDLIAVSIRPRTELDGAAAAKALVESWRAKGAAVEPGPAGWLPEPDWPGQRVYHFEATVTPPVTDGATPPRRLHIDGYVLLTGRDQGVYVEAGTSQHAAGEFRAQVEDVLRSFRFAGTVGAR